jgi:DNA-binding HxlR family transcriptional regulator
VPRLSILKRQLSGITPKILAEQLREMERDGLLQRRVYPEVPPRVEYQLTPRGKTLEPVIDAMCAWGTEQLRTGFNSHVLYHSFKPVTTLVQAD